MTIAADVRVMGILNVTPDSFSDGGRYRSIEAAVDHARHLIAAGADIIDVGGESTRPYAEPVGIDEELARVMPVIESIRSWSTIPLSIDTSKAAVARQALAAGATIINDVSALRRDPEMIDVVRSSSGEVVIMHMQGTPGTMQDDPHYDDVVGEIVAFFRDRLALIASAGVDLRRVIIDPGIGFGKTLKHNLSIIKHLDRLSELGQPVLLGHSRKRFLGELTGIETPDRDLVSAVVSALALDRRAALFRVHDVASTKAALQVARAVSEAS